jgi:superfamily II RNA helicase
MPPVLSVRVSQCCEDQLVIDWCLLMGYYHAGNPSLYRKMEAASQCIKRDIVFAASLYT